MTFRQSLQGRAVCLLAAVLSLLCGADAALAHPHAWIDFRTTIVLDDANRMTAIKEHWLFDPYYTEFAMRDFNPNKDGKITHALLMDLAKDNLKNLGPFCYFTILEQENAKSAVEVPVDIDSYLVKGQIALDFTLKLEKPLDLAKKKADYRIYDPSYYISMLHAKKDPILFEGKKAASCKHDLVTPKPDIMKINFAASIDKTGQAPDELGSFFAQRMTLSCP